MSAPRWKVAVYGALYTFLRGIQERAERAADRFKLCERCGRNPYTGAPCVGQEEQERREGRLTEVQSRRTL